MVKNRQLYSHLASLQDSGTTSTTSRDTVPSHTVSDSRHGRDDSSDSEDECGERECSEVALQADPELAAGLEELARHCRLSERKHGKRT